ncbi:uncharacterized protein LOC124891090 [Capsicum annuum]|uniref:uncharacterized protein LOC124891090 n=1 Tax=Capsicum annuum TaxID=4072 RepID=UPI001FB10C2A|nr:uncharacterized protein LOC124891090 [Capsicum annuum]
MSLVKLKKAPPKSQEDNAEKEMVEVGEEVVEIEKPQSNMIFTIQVPPTYLQRIQKIEEGDKIIKFMAKLSNISINIPLLKAIQEILRYAKQIKKLMLRKNLIEGDTIEVTHICSAIISSKIEEMKEEPKAFTIPCTIRTHMFAKNLCDLGASINLMPFSIYKEH